MRMPMGMEAVSMPVILGYGAPDMLWTSSAPRYDSGACCDRFWHGAAGRRQRRLALPLSLGGPHGMVRADSHHIGDAHATGRAGEVVALSIRAVCQHNAESALGHRQLLHQLHS